MASTNTRLFRLVSSRWLGSRVESSEGQIDGPEPARLAGEETLPSNERLAKLAATLKSGVNRVRLSSRYLVPAQKKLSVPAYASESGQSLEDAMSEYNESVKQYYGVQLTNPDVEAIISQNTIVETGVAKVENLSNLSRKVIINPHFLYLYNNLIHSICFLYPMTPGHEQFSFDGVMGRSRVGAVSEFPIRKGRQLHIYCSDSEWSFSKKQISVTRITTARMIQRKWDLMTKT